MINTRNTLSIPIISFQTLNIIYVAGALNIVYEVVGILRVSLEEHKLFTLYNGFTSHLC